MKKSLLIIRNNITAVKTAVEQPELVAATSEDRVDKIIKVTDPILFFDGLFKSDSGEKIEDPINDYNCHGSWSPNMNVQSLASDRYQSADQSDKNDIIYAGDDKEYMKYTFRFIGSSLMSCCFRTISNDSLKIFHLEGFIFINRISGFNF